LPALVIRRARADWAVLVTGWLLLACATTLLTAGVIYGNTVADSGLRRALAAQPVASRTVVLQAAIRSERIDPSDSVITQTLARALAAGHGSVALTARSEAYAPVGSAAGDQSRLVLLATYGDLAVHATITQGRWPEQGREPTEVTLGEGAAAALGLTPGDRISLANRVATSLRADVIVVGIWRPTAGDPYWLGDALEREGMQTTAGFTKRGPLMLGRLDFLRLMAGRQVSADWRALPAIADLRVDDVEPLQAGLVSLQADIQAQLPPSPRFGVVTGMPAALAQVSRGLLVSRSGVLLLTIEFAVLAGYAVILVGSLFADRRRGEAALLQTRGASHAHLAQIALAEAVLLALPAAVAAPFLALGAIAILGAVGPLADSGMLNGATIDGRAIAVSALTGLACVAMLVVPTVLSGVTPAGARAVLGRPLARTLAQRLGIDLALLVVAGLCLWQLRLYGSSLTQNASGSLGVDPLLVAAPAIGLLAGAVAATRFLPRIAEIAERFSRRRSGLTTPLGARQIARRPLRYTRSALLLLLAAALGTFAVIYQTTWIQANTDEASYQAPADQRLVMTDYPQLPSWAVGPALRAIPGVIAAMPVTRTTFSAGRTISSGDALAFDPAAFADVAALPHELVAAGLPQLLARLSEARAAPAGLEIGVSPRRLGITVDAEMHAVVGAAPADPDAGSIDLIVVLENPDGIHRLKASAGRLNGAGQILEVPLSQTVRGAETGMRGPIRVLSIELTVVAPTGSVMAGTVDLRGVSVSPAVSGDDWQALSFDAGAAGWLWTSVIDGVAGTYQPPAGTPGRILVPDETPIFGGSGSPPPNYRIRSLPQLPAQVPAIVSQRFLDDTGSQVGDSVPIRVRAQTVSLRIIGATPIFPPLKPASPFVLLDGPALATAAFARTGSITPPREWWLDSEGADVADVLAAAREPVFGTSSVSSRSELIRSLTSDPVPIGLVGALGLGALAALVIAALGFLMGATASAAERTGEFALLRALGLPSRSVSSWLVFENFLMLCFGAAVGLGLGLLLAWLVLPFATLTQTGAAPASAAQIVVPWSVLLPSVAGLVAILVTAAAIVTRQVPAGRLSGVLRARDSG
jgi:hypothetical protein